METNIQSLVFTSLTVPDLRQIFRKEIEDFFTNQPAVKHLQQNPPDKFLTIHEAADFLHLSINTIYGLTSRQVIPFMKTGKKLIFLEKDLIAYIKNTRQKTVAEIESDANAFLANQGSRRKVPTPT